MDDVQPQRASIVRHWATIAESWADFDRETLGERHSSLGLIALGGPICGRALGASEKQANLMYVH